MKQKIFLLTMLSVLFLTLGLSVQKANATEVNPAVNQVQTAGNGWVTISGTKYYVDMSGNKQKGWLLLGDTWYYFDPTTGAMKTDWLLYNGYWYYLDDTGKMQTGWYLANGKWFYSNGSGIMLTGWIQDQGDWYYLKMNGEMQTGWLFYNNDWYFLDLSGRMASGWYLVGNQWYFSDQHGIMQTGWIKDYTGTEYYLLPSGAWKSDLLELEGRIIVLDPGHGGTDVGATAGGVYEKDLNLAVSLKLRDLLTKHHATVYMTRSTDEFITLTGRVAFSNSKKPSAFISVHTNSAGQTAVGIETFHNSEKGIMPEESKELAQAIQSELLKTTGAVDRKVKDANFAVTRNNNTPAVLVEMGFITNDGERANLTNGSYQDKIVLGIYNGIDKFFN